MAYQQQPYGQRPHGGYQQQAPAGGGGGGMFGKLGQGFQNLTTKVDGYVHGQPQQQQQHGAPMSGPPPVDIKGVYYDHQTRQDLVITQDQTGAWEARGQSVQTTGRVDQFQGALWTRDDTAWRDFGSRDINWNSGNKWQFRNQ